jgi:hemerythrin-like domain-containing protein
MRPLLQPLSPSIEDPLELLQACHDKVRRFSALVPRLREHLARHGPDAQAQEAAQSILRYFEVAAPLHHDDEEQDLFPALRALGQATLNRQMDDLQAEHDELAHLWQQIRPWLQATAAGQALACPDAAESFAQRYPAHAQKEEDKVYPAAVGLDEASLRRISAAMVARRTQA